MAKLATYRAKRNFTRTAEPKGASSRRSGASFVVQKHDASRLHYDFRLEMDGVLKSWAVAKGPSLVAGEKRLAVEVEDHPVAYGSFEGTIPDGEYGGGTVLLWDQGTWSPDGSAQEGFEKGRLTFTLAGHKLKGAWHLVRMKPRPREKQPSWLLIKAEDAFARSPDAPDILDEAPLSVKTGRSLEEIGGPTRETTPKRAAPRKSAPPAAGKTGAAKGATNAVPRKSAGKAAHSVEIAGVTLTHPDRVLWEDEGLTKQDLAAYYVSIADWILPHLAGRPLTLLRCPSGTAKACFVQRHSWAGASDAIRRRIVRGAGESEELLYVEDIRGVVALVQAGVVEMHVWGSTLGDPDRPDRLIFDFDPGDGVAWAAVVDAARHLRERLQGIGLESFVKGTGGKGLHVVVPVKSSASWPDALAFSRSIAEAMAADEPDRYTTTSVKEERAGKIFVDYLRNNREASAVAAYSTRARAGAPVSVPIAWSELSHDTSPNAFTVKTLPGRLSGLHADPWQGLMLLEQALPIASGRGRKRKR
jgi:bifunctional non-homologous end joining protein LigD